MKVLNGILITLAVLFGLVVLYFCFACVCKAFDFLPTMTSWLETNIFEPIGWTFFGKI